MRMPLPVAVVLLLCTGGAHAQAVYRCVEKGKPVSFQSAPCAPGAKLAAIREYTPEPEPTPQEKRERDAHWATRPLQPASIRTAATRTRRSAAPPPCESMKAERDRWERRVGLRRSYDALRTWNDRVADACR